MKYRIWNRDQQGHVADSAVSSSVLHAMRSWPSWSRGGFIVNPSVQHEIVVIAATWRTRRASVRLGTPEIVATVVTWQARHEPVRSGTYEIVTIMVTWRFSHETVRSAVA